MLLRFCACARGPLQLLEGSSENAKDAKRGEMLLNKAASLGHRSAQYDLAALHHSRKDHVQVRGIGYVRAVY